MWGTFGGKRRAQRNAPTVLKELAEPSALLSALAEMLRIHVDDVHAGRVPYPIHRSNASLIEVWRYLRLEAFQNIFNFGMSDPVLLCSHRDQVKLLSSFVLEKPHMELPQPRGETLPDTIQGMWQVYVYLGNVGSEVGDRETGEMELRLSGRSILDELTAEAWKLLDQWKTFERAVQERRVLPRMPRTLIEPLFADVTRKAKSAAFSAVLGPSYERGIEHLVKLAAERDDAASGVRAVIDRVLAANDPDQLG